MCQVRRVELEEVSKAASADFARSLEQRPLEFGFEAGQVRMVCASSADPIWVLNIKKGIVSMFQHRLSRLSARSAL